FSRCVAGSVEELVVIPALRDQQAVLSGAVDQPVLLGDPARTPAGQGAAQGFGLARPGEGCAKALLDEAVEARRQPGILSLPVKIVLPGALAEDQFHSVSGRSCPSPRSSSATDSSSRSALAGLRSR